MGVERIQAEFRRDGGKNIITGHIFIRMLVIKEMNEMVNIPKDIMETYGILNIQNRSRIVC